LPYRSTLIFHFVRLCPKDTAEKRIIDNAKRKVTCALCVLPPSLEQCKDAREYQEKGHHSGDDKQQEFTEEVWFHQLISTHGPHPSALPIFAQLARKHDPLTPSNRGLRCWGMDGNGQLQ